MNSYMPRDDYYYTDLDQIWGDCTEVRRVFGKQGERGVGLNPDQGFASLELLTFWTRPFFVVLRRVEYGVWPLY